MKVKCINTDGWAYRKKIFGINLGIWDTTGPKFGEVVTVIGERYTDGVKYYELLEWPTDDDSYEATCFEPLEEMYEKVSIKQIKEQPCVN